MGFDTLTLYGAVKSGVTPTVSTVVTSTATGAQNNWAPGVVGDTTILWSGASLLSVTGFSNTGVATGTTLVFRNTGTALATFAHASGSSSVGNKLTNIATSAVTPVGAGGFAVWVYNGTVWMLITGDSCWITPTFAAGDYTGSGSLTWTVASGDVDLMRYRLQGNTLSVQFSVITSSTGGTASTGLLVGNGAWGGFSIAAGANFLLPGGIHLDAGGASVVGRTRVDTADATHIVNQLINGGNWSNAASDNTYVRGSVQFAVT